MLSLSMPALPPQLTSTAAEFVAGMLKKTAERGLLKWQKELGHTALPRESKFLSEQSGFQLLFYRGMLEVDKGAVLAATGAYLGLTVRSSLYFNIVKGDLQL